MNLPKRLSARRNRTECPEHVKDAAGPDPGEVDHLNWVAATVGEYGWAVSGSRAERKAPPWAYSIGIWLTCQVPELILCGLPVEAAASIINAIGARAADGVDITPRDGARRRLPDAARVPSGRPELAQVPAADDLRLLLRHGQGAVPAGRLVGPRQPVPLGTRVPRGFERTQPLLWLPRDDNPPSPWTRLEQ